ncbi:MAG TPA: YraN family protein [Patescibacteria group bacterium]
MVKDLFKQEEGRRGEDLACEYLKKLNFKIIERNFRIRVGEIDIVAIDDLTLVFVEVKTRKTTEFGIPLEQITPWKIKPMIKTA